MWKVLRGSRLGFKFRRERPTGPDRLEAYSAEARLALEMDGEQHDSGCDQTSGQWLLDQGIATLRIPLLRFFLPENAPYQDGGTEIIEACRLRTGRDPE